MTAKRTDMHRLQELVRLHRLDTGAREVRLLRFNHFDSRSRRGTEAGAILYSLVESAKRATVELAAYLDHAARADAVRSPEPLERPRGRLHSPEGRRDAAPPGGGDDRPPRARAK